MPARLPKLVRHLGALTLFCALALAGCGRDTPQALIESGNAYLAKKDAKSAVIQFKAALQADPQSAQARYLLGRAMLEAGDPAAATVELSKAMDQRYDETLVLPALARALLLSGGAKKLTTLYGNVELKDKPANAALKASLAVGWGVQGETAKATEALAASLASVPDFPQALILQARIRASEGKYDEALATVDGILARDKANYEAWTLKGEILAIAKNDTQGAEQAFRSALAAEKAFVPAHRGLIRLALKAGDIKAAKAQADQLRAVLPKHPETTFIDAQIALYDKDLKKAHELSQLLVRYAPDNVAVLQLAGSVEGLSGSLVVAEKYFSKALNISPELPLARRGLARVYLRLGEPTKALHAVEPMVGPDGSDAEALALAGEAQLQLGDAHAAEAMFLQAAKFSPGDPKLRTALALMTLSHGDAETAFAQLGAVSAASQDSAADMAIVSARLKRQEYEQALRALDVMARKQPGSATVFELRGLVQDARKDYAAARAAFEQALAIEPSRFSSISNLAALDTREGKLDDARKRLEAAVKADPRNHLARQALAEVMNRQGRPLAEIREMLAEGIQVAPDAPGPRLQLIELLLSKRQYKEALAVAQDATATLPNDPDLLDAMGRAQMLAGDTQQAISTFRRLTNVDTRSARPYLRLADLQKSIGERDAAVASLRRALEIEPNLEAAQTRLMDILIADGKPKGALEMARSMQLRAPGAASGYLLEGAIQRRLKAPDAALVAYRNGLQKASEKSELAVEIHRTLVLIKGRAAEADRFAQDWLKEHPNDLNFEFQLASVYMLQNDLERAETLLRHFVSQRPNQPMALNNLAWVLASRGKPGAIAYAQKAVDLLPNRPALIDTLAMALAADNQLPKALEMQKKAVEVSPNDMALRLNLARIALQAGDKALARTELDRLAAMGTKLPYHETVTRLQKSL